MVHALLAAALAAVSAGAPSPDAQAAQFEAKVLEELARVAPGAVDAARAAGEAYHARRWQEAFDGYAAVLAAAPRFDHALRRQCRARAALGDRAAAVPLCRAALAAAGTSPNQIALAVVLSRAGQGEQASQADLSEAARLASAALDGDRESSTTAVEAGFVGLRAQADALVKRGAERSEALAPNELATHYLGVFAALMDERWHGARRHLAAARKLGLDAEEAARLEGMLNEYEPAWSRWGSTLLWGVGGWLAALVLLLATGAALSAATLRGARTMATQRRAQEGAGARALRRVYAGVLWVTCALYYLSLPLVALLVAGVGYGVWAAFAAVGRIPVKLVLIVALMVAVSFWAVLKSVWASVVRRREGDPGQRLAVAEHPRFDAALHQAAARVDTRPVDAVFLTPGTDAAVYERGGLAARMRGKSERCLILGIGLLEGMTQKQLKAVLAHEYGHFVNRDTAGGGLALAVRRSVLQMAQALASGGAAAWYNPAWQFVVNFHKLFLRISQGASRLQEVLADRWAALAYGGAAFAGGLTHVVTASIRFDQHANASLQEVVEGKRALANLYRFVPARPVAEDEVARKAEEALAAEPSPYDSHPRPKDRIAWVGDVAAAYGAVAGDDAPAWDLFADREALERSLTAVVRSNLAARHGVQISGEEPAAPSV